ncbi:hypothetical protein BCR43DRAFT_546768 [Syncephalastrum racemosum]|uniref:Uncharacterized protein n=1 Tax=Syncephalastrum racemosum TaxID=13706 RepID=A0A1X2HGJ7_SYNRA|nr:hypothetical protein BCR43DRAFT_546768 [Syncephalastrum racemosum]
MPAEDTEPPSATTAAARGDEGVVQPPSYHRQGSSSRDIHDDSPSTTEESLDKKPSLSETFLYRLSTTRELFSMIFLPITNVVVSVALMGVLIYVYQRSEGMHVSEKLGTMTPPALVSLLITLLKMCIAGGIGFALSEYKWVHLQDGGKLSLLDFYDACTRGFGGILRIFTRSLYLDKVLLPAIIFHIALIALSPGSQQILRLVTPSMCVRPASIPGVGPGAGLSANNITHSSMSSLQYPYDPRQNFGLEANYPITFALDSVAYNTSFSINGWRPTDAVNTTFKNFPIPSTTMTCEPGSFTETQIINAKDVNNTVTLAQYFNYSDSDPSTYPTTPQYFFPGFMKGRTPYDFEVAWIPTFLNPDYDPGLQQFVGNQSFVILSKQGRADYGNVSAAEAQVDICTLHSAINLTDIVMYQAARFVFHTQSTTPIDMDRVMLSNGSAWRLSDMNDEIFYTLLNLYSLQVSIVNTLTLTAQSALQTRIAKHWVQQQPEGRNSILTFTRDVLYKADYATVFARPPMLAVYPDVISCYVNESIYTIDTAAYYTWWLVMWVVALYQTNGISRGNSQIALLVTGLTDNARRMMRGLSHAGQNTLYNHASNIDVTFGETVTSDGRPGHVAFGVQDEMNPIRVRRGSFSAAA